MYSTTYIDAFESALHTELSISEHPVSEVPLQVLIMAERHMYNVLCSRSQQ